MVRPTRPVAPTTATVRGRWEDSMGMVLFLWIFHRGHATMITRLVRSLDAPYATVEW